MKVEDVWRAQRMPGLVFFDGGRGNNVSYFCHSPVRELRHVNGVFLDLCKGVATPVDPRKWLILHSRQHILAGYLGFEFGWELLDLPPHPKAHGEECLWVGAYEDCQTVELDFSTTHPVVASDFSTPDRAHYLTSVTKARKAIGEGEFFEVNFTGMFRCESPSDALHIHSQLRSRATGDYFVLLNSPSYTLCSVSPELFLKVENGHILTAPIKGTRRRSSDPQEDQRLKEELMASEKDRAENIMIVDLMRNDLTPLSVPGTVRVSALCAVESFANVHHLVSRVTSELLPDSHGMDVFLSCFPAGSITGAPKLRAMEWIAENESELRGPYTGSAFLSWPNGNLISNVLIRTAVGDGTHWRYGAGGAVVSDSSPVEEYEEALTKAGVFMELADGS